jgi:hypothetical protein
MNSTALIICIFEISRNGGNLYFFLTKREFRHLHFYIQLKDNINEKKFNFIYHKRKDKIEINECSSFKYGKCRKISP